MDDLLQAIAWRDCLMYSITDDGIRARFEADTGLRYTAPVSALDRMIDDATNHGAEYGRRFIEWFNENIWGVENVPQSALNASTASS